MKFKLLTHVKSEIQFSIHYVNNLLDNRHWFSQAGKRRPNLANLVTTV